MELTCINCPVGCRIEATVENGEVTKITGNGCLLGERYAKQEAIKPLRMITAVVGVKGSNTPVSVKTRTPVPKELIAQIMDQIEAVQLTAPIRMGDVVLPNVLDTGVDVIATKTVAAE